MVDDHAARAVILCRNPFPAGQEIVVHVAEERSDRFGKSRFLRRPVVHLEIDVRVVVGVPRCVQSLGPHTLQIGRQGILTAGRDEKVLAKLVVQRDEGRILRIRIVFQAFQPLVDRDIVQRAVRVERDVGPFHDGGEVGDMFCKQRVPAALGFREYSGNGGCHIVMAERGGNGGVENHVGRVRDRDPLRVCRCFAVGDDAGREGERVGSHSGVAKGGEMVALVGQPIDVFTAVGDLRGKRSGGGESCAGQSRRMGAEYLASVGYAVLVITDRADTLGEFEITPVIFTRVVLMELYGHFSRVFVGMDPEEAVLHRLGRVPIGFPFVIGKIERARFFKDFAVALDLCVHRTARPDCFFVEAQLFRADTSVEGHAEPAGAGWCYVFPVDSRVGKMQDIRFHNDLLKWLCVSRVRSLISSGIATTG